MLLVILSLSEKLLSEALQLLFCHDQGCSLLRQLSLIVLSYLVGGGCQGLFQQFVI
jgi:hypothetical protein